MAAHDQVRLILNSHQLDKSISLPFLQRDRLTPERFLAAIEHVVQSNDQFTLDDSVSVNVVHVEDDGKHIPNLCVVQNESGDEKVFSGPNTKDEFCTWVFKQENANTTFVAHNLQTYDGYFILRYLYKNGITQEIITRGAKILSLTVSEMNIKFIDSLCIIPMKLAAFPKTFGLTQLQKCYFPHFFNRAENQDYAGPLPDSKFYDPDGMSTDDREKFYTWYNDLSERRHRLEDSGLGRSTR